MPGTIVTCVCGAKVRLPSDVADASVRCPRCKAELGAPAATPATASAATAPSGPPSVTLATLPTGAQTICSICQTGIGVGEQTITCSGCDQVHHQECWQEVGGCGTFGCSQAPAADDDEKSAQAPLTAWGDTKKCPACGETIKSIAVKCRYCLTDFGSLDPMSAADLRRQALTSSELDSFKKVVVGLFAASIVGFLAPLIAIVASLYLLPRRDKLAKCGPVFTIMGWTSIVLSCIYTVLLAAFYLVAN